MRWLHLRVGSMYLATRVLAGLTAAEAPLF